MGTRHDGTDRRRARRTRAGQRRLSEMALRAGVAARQQSPLPSAPRRGAGTRRPRGPTGPCPRPAVRTSRVHARRPRRRRRLPRSFAITESGQPGRRVRDTTSANILAEVSPCPLTPLDLGVDRSLDRNALARREVLADLVLVDFALHDGAEVHDTGGDLGPAQQVATGTEAALAEDQLAHEATRRWAAAARPRRCCSPGRAGRPYRGDAGPRW